MAKNFDLVVASDHFSSSQNVFGDGDRRAESLSGFVRSLIQREARSAVAAAAIAPLSDLSNPGGTGPGGTAGALYLSQLGGVLSSNDLTGLTTGVQSAALNAAADTYMNAYREVAAKANAMLDAIFGAGVASLDEGPGAAANGTIETVIVAVTANTVDTDAATAASADAVRQDLLHAQRTMILALDDLREATGLARRFSDSVGSYDATGNLTFATGPDTITRSAGSWIADGFTVGDKVRVGGTASNNTGEVRRTISNLTATVMTLSGTGLAAEGPTAGTLMKVQTVSKGAFPGSLAGADRGPALDESLPGAAVAAPAGSDWTLDFLTGTGAISDAVDGADATAAALKTEVDAFLAELLDNVAFAVADVATLVAVTAGAPGRAAMSR